MEFKQNKNDGGAARKPAVRAIKAEPKTEQIIKKAYPLALLGAAERVHAVCEEYHREGWEAFEKGRRVPFQLGELAKQLEPTFAGTRYEQAFEKIMGMVLAENHYLRYGGQLLLGELIFGQRHLEHCNPADLHHLGWDGDGTDAHRWQDPVYSLKVVKEICAEMLLREACERKGDVRSFCFDTVLLVVFVDAGLEFAAADVARWAVPAEGDMEQRDNEKCAKLFAKYLRETDYDVKRRMPIFWHDAYACAGGFLKWPTNEAFFNAIRKPVAAELMMMRKGLEETGEPLGWLAENTRCIFVGAMRLARLTDHLYHAAIKDKDERLQRNAFALLQELSKEPDLHEKLERMGGIQKADLDRKFHEAKTLVETIREDRVKAFYESFYYTEVVRGRITFKGFVNRSGKSADILCEIGEEKFEKRDFYGAAEAFGLACELYHNIAAAFQYHEERPNHRKAVAQAYSLEAESRRRQAEALENAGDLKGACEALQREISARGSQIYFLEHINDELRIPPRRESEDAMSRHNRIRYERIHIRRVGDIKGANEAQQLAEQARQKMEELRKKLKKQ